MIWAATVATYLVTGGGQSLSTDDAMRLVQVRDLLAGQSWFDLTQYRLSPPDGVAMHWSRLIDLPIALLIRAGELVLAPALAERLALGGLARRRCCWHCCSASRGSRASSPTTPPRGWR